MSEIEVTLTTPTKLVIRKQWLCVVVVKIAAFPVAGPAVKQRTPVVFIHESAKNPEDSVLVKRAVELLGTDDFTVMKVETYPCDSVQIKSINEPLPDGPDEK